MKQLLRPARLRRTIDNYVYGGEPLAAGVCAAVSLRALALALELCTHVVIEGGLAATGGGYGLQQGMRERAQLLGGTLSAGSIDRGWRVELRLPPPAGPAPAPEQGNGR